MAHEKGILHRNLRPEHILVTEQGLAKVMEFSPSSTPRAGSNPACSAPELSREAASAASDVYALGACLYEAVTGLPPAAPFGASRIPGGARFLTDGAAADILCACLVRIWSAPRWRKWQTR